MLQRWSRTKAPLTDDWGRARSTMGAIDLRHGKERAVISDDALQEPKIVLCNQSLHCLLAVLFPGVVELSVNTLVYECLGQVTRY